MPTLVLENLFDVLREHFSEARLVELFQVAPSFE
jgi:hypothetical protein